MHLLGGGLDPLAAESLLLGGGVILPLQLQRSLWGLIFQAKGTEVLPKSFIFSCVLPRCLRRTTGYHSTLFLNGVCLLSVLRHREDRRAVGPFQAYDIPEAAMARPELRPFFRHADLETRMTKFEDAAEGGILFARMPRNEIKLINN